MTRWYGGIRVHVTTHRNLTGRSCFILRDPVNFGNKIHSSFTVSDHPEHLPCAYEGWTFREKPARSCMSYARSLPTVGQLPKATTRCFSLTLMYRTTAILMEHSPRRQRGCWLRVGRTMATILVNVVFRNTRQGKLLRLSFPFLNEVQLYRYHYSPLTKVTPLFEKASSSFPMTLFRAMLNKIHARLI